MVDKKQLCENILQIYPDIGQCGIDMDVQYDKAQKSWVVYLNKGHQKMKHFLPGEDADLCMDGKQCVRLGLEIAQFAR